MSFLIRFLTRGKPQAPHRLHPELVIPKGIPSKKAKAETEIHPVAAKAKIRKCPI